MEGSIDGNDKSSGSWKRRKGWILKCSREINENILQPDLLDNKAMWMDCFRFET